MLPGDLGGQKPGSNANPIEHVGRVATRQFVGELAEVGKIDPLTSRLACGLRGDSL
jgi:hypothetical protein